MEAWSTTVPLLAARHTIIVSLATNWCLGIRYEAAYREGCGLVWLLAVPVSILYTVIIRQRLGSNLQF